jgi:hypothetical protein
MLLAALGGRVYARISRRRHGASCSEWLFKEKDAGVCEVKPLQHEIRSKSYQAQLYFLYQNRRSKEKDFQMLASA